MALNKRYEKERPLTHNEVDANWDEIESRLGQKAATSHTHNISQIVDLQTELGGKIPLSEKGTNNGVATLNSNGKVPYEQLPPFPAAQRVGQRFPHNSLTQQDIGKLVIWKDGMAQLPVFEPAVEYTPWIFEFIYNGDSLPGFNPDELVIEFTKQPMHGDGIKLTDSLSVLFTDTTPMANEVQIGSTLQETISNLNDYINMSSGGYITSQANVDSLSIYSWDLGLDSQIWSFRGDFWIDAAITEGDFATLHHNFTGIKSRLGRVFCVYLFLKDGGFVDSPLKTPDSFIDSCNMFSNIFEQLVYVGTETTIKVPSSLEEVKDALSYFFNDLVDDEYIDSATWESGNKLRVGLWDIPEDVEDSGIWNIRISNENSSLWDDAFQDGTMVQEPSGHRAYCKYYVLGQVKEVFVNEVEINPDSISEYLVISTAAPQEGTDLRYYWLDPDNPGYVMPMRLDGIIHMKEIDVYGVFYVESIEDNPSQEGRFVGNMRRDITPRLLLRIILSS